MTYEEAHKETVDISLLSLIQFTENVSLKIYGIHTEENIFSTVIARFKENPDYTCTIMRLTDDASHLKIIDTTISKKDMTEGERVVGKKTKEFRINLKKSPSYRKVIVEGQTLPVQSATLLRELFPRPLAALLLRLLGLRNKESILTPIRKHGENVGVLAVSSLGFTNSIVPSIKNLGAHISHALDLALERKERRSAENALREMVQKYQDITDRSVDGIFSFDAHGVFTYASHAVIDIAGYQPDEVVGRPFTDFIAPTSLSQSSEVLTELLEGKIVHDVPLTIMKKDGSEALVSINASPIIKNKEIVGVQGIVRDVTERTRILQQLGETEQQFKAVIDNIGVGVSLISPQMEILALNPQMMAWFPGIDVTKKPVCYRSFNDPPRAEVCSYCPTSRTLQDGEVHEDITKTPHPDGVKNYRIVSSPITNDEGMVIAAIEMVEDITEKLRLQETLAETEKMAALGRIASVVSHELNTPLANIALAVEYLRVQLGKKGASELTTIKKEVTHASHIIQRLLSFSRMEDLELKPLDLSQILIEAVDNISQIMDLSNIQLTNHVNTSMIIQGEHFRLLEAFTNILKNAVEATDASKTKHCIEIAHEQTDNGIVINVTDNGQGMEKDTLEKAMKPFFTTKAPEEGTGLGLFITQWVIQQHGGTLSITSDYKLGTTVAVTLPFYHL